MKLLDEIPEAAWKRNLDHPIPEKLAEIKLGLMEIAHFLPLYFRARAYFKRAKKAGIDAVNMFRPVQVYAVHGVPIGGIGSGTIGKGWRGDFNRWQRIPGIYHRDPVKANQFSVFVKPNGKNAKSIVLTPDVQQNNFLSAWNWNFDGQNSTYHALYPFAWTKYDDIIPGVNLMCKQISPIIPHNYKESSFPTGIFVWNVENKTEEDLELSIMFSFQNGMGTENDMKGGHSNEYFKLETKKGEIHGIKLNHVHRLKKPLKKNQKLKNQEIFEDPLTYAIAALEDSDVNISHCSCFITNGEGENIWNDFSKTGEIKDITRENGISVEGETIGGAIAVKINLKANEEKHIVFNLSWDMPIARFGLGRGHYRRYTRFYGKEGNNVEKIVKDSFENFEKWDKEIKKWHKPVLESEEIPLWLKTTLINETYFIADGGTVWTDGEVNAESLPEDHFGQFLYLESHQYLMYNTYDVHFYASFALAQLWPELELNIQRDFAKAVLDQDPEIRKMYGDGSKSVRNILGSVPHDIGAPMEDPWTKVNAYPMWDISLWKDLNPKFVLQVYRDYIATGKKEFVQEVWEAVKLAVEFMLKFDLDNDGLIDNSGFPDQTYDVWSVTGASSYSGGLGLAALTAAIELAKLVEDRDVIEKYKTILDKGKQSYEEKLWNGKYYNYDSSKSTHYNSIMADQLAGQWYCDACDLDPIIPKKNAKSALRTVYEFNVMKFNNGQMGAINGMKPNGEIDKTCLQSREVWTGTTYGVAAAMYQLGLEKEALQTAKGIYNVTYETHGYWFQTPEAWDEFGNFRSFAYMRPLSVWAIYWAIKRK